MYEKILLDLLKIVEMEGIDRGSGKLARIRAIHYWMDENLVNVKYSQDVVKTKLTSEEEDFLKYHLASKIGEELMEEAVTVDTTNNKITAQVVAFKRFNK